MSQGNWGGGGQPPGGWGGGGGYGPPGGAPPGAPPGGGYGPPPGGAPPGGYGPPGGAPPGGFGPPGGAPPGGFGPPGGAPPGGFGPPGGGYGPPPGGAGYGPPPGAGGFPDPGGGFGGGQRVQFLGEGGKLLVTFLIWMLGPSFVAGVIYAIFAGIGMAVGTDRRGNLEALGAVMMGIGGLIALVIAVIGGIMLQNKILEFRWENTVMDGQRCRYTGTAGGLFKAMIVPLILTYFTLGIYAPWMVCKIWAWQFENIEVNGQRGRLTFHGDGGSLLGKWILGAILMYCTCFIYGAWFANDIFAFYWENTKLDGRGFGFRKDPGGFLGTYILTAVLCYCTAYIYLPWGLCNIIKWESERVS